MCPDKELLSIYLDGELPSPWKEKLTAHMETCEECRERFAAMQGLSTRLRDGVPSAASIAGAGERIWGKLEPIAEVKRPVFWKRPLVLPLPAAAAAALIIVALAAVFILKPSRNGTDRMMAATISTDLHEAIPVSDMSGVLNYLDSQEGQGGIVIIRLPESQHFTPSGEPTLVRAADYHPSDFKGGTQP